jgi:hypothetical protein
MKRLTGRLTYANVVATLALFIALAGGTAFAATQILPKNSVGTEQIRDSSITGAKIAPGAITGADVISDSLGNVPGATHAATADHAAQAAHANSADHADSAGTATSAADAAALGGTPAGGYAKRALEAEHVVGKPGQPPFENGCENFFPGDISEVGFYRDPMGVVHLRGYAVGCTEDDSIFILPVGFRPAEGEFFAVANGNESSGLIEVTAEGEVALFGGTKAGLSNVEFRTDG